MTDQRPPSPPAGAEPDDAQRRLHELAERLRRGAVRAGERALAARPPVPHWSEREERGDDVEEGT